MAEFHAAFAAFAAGRGERGLEAFLSDPAAPGLKVYRNNVAKGAADGLAQAYPAVARLVGERFFTAMATVFRDAQPPDDPVLALYGEGFDTFIERFEPARSLSYLPDVARLDRAWLEAHHAPEQDALTLADLADLPPESLSALKLYRHSSAHVMAFELPVYSIWRTNREDASVEKVRLDEGPQTALIWRSAGEVRHRRSTAAQHALLTALEAGAPLYEAADYAVSKAGASDPVSLAFGLISDGLFKGTLK